MIDSECALHENILQYVHFKNKGFCSDAIDLVSFECLKKSKEPFVEWKDPMDVNGSTIDANQQKE